MISLLAPVDSNVESWGISRRAALRTRNRPQIPRLSSVVWFVTIRVLVCLETIRVLVTLETIPVLVSLETIPVLRSLETNPVLTMILDTSIVSKMNFKEKTKLSSMSEKMM